ncbi:MAG: oxygenase [Alphaproteobacteria bacterium]|uniref:TauD/TfdA-like domain-containing protein n=1 Tax=viral metagenome TaxID=1070528 RepID=A0A6C0HQS5_9ZZZZ|nr:oxygenase [Alphaproteobacteria bacterium]
MELSHEENICLIKLAECITAHPSKSPTLFCRQAKEQAEKLPPRIKNALTNFAEKGSETGFLLIQGIPIQPDTIPKTPEGNQYKLGETTTLAKIQAILVSAIGDMIAYEAECYGNLFQDVVPLRTMEKAQTSLGSNTELEIHTEQAFSKLKPDILSLACLRGDPDAFTHIFPVQTILNNLTTEENALLREPLWYTGVDLSFKLNNNEFIDGDLRGPMPIISGSPNDPILIFDQDLMIGTTEESKEMIKKIINIYYQKKIRHNLKQGEIILVDNNRAVHGRSAFKPKYDGEDRFLIRCFATFDIGKSEYARDNSKSPRTIAAIYS